MGQFNKQTLRDVDVCGKKVLLRVDFNVSFANGLISDDTRIRAALPTINYLLQQQAAIIIISHLGRPKGQKNKEYSLKPVALALAKLLERPVQFVGDCCGATAQKQAAALAEGGILLLENLRFHAEEEENDPLFAAQLAALADIYVNDAFGMAHRAHASTAGVAEYLPAVAGLLMERELASLAQALAQPQHPFTAIIGGAKVADKISMIENLLPKVDHLLIGGGMANTFLAAQGYDMRSSRVEEERLPWVVDLLASEQGSKLVLPEDVVAAAEFADGAMHKNVMPYAIPENWQALDIGEVSQQKFTNIIAESSTIVWNGPVGVFELDDYAAGTIAIAQAVADSGAFSIVGGGDSITALHKTGLASHISHISTGGGAMLKFLEGKKLPGVEALN